MNDEKPSLYLLDLRSGAQRTLFTSKPDLFYREAVGFSPGGDEVVFEIRSVSSLGFEDVLVVQQLEKGTTRELLRSSELVNGPVWAGDGFVYYQTEGSLMRIAATGGQPEVFGSVAGAREARGGGSVAIAPSGQTAAFTVELDDCAHVAVVGLQPGSEVRLLGCGFNPVWSNNKSSELLYIAYPNDGSRIARAMDLGTGHERDLGFAPGVTAAIASDPDGDVYVLMTRPDVPRSAWRVDAASGKRDLLFGSPGPANQQVLDRWTVAAPDGVAIPVLVFRSTCRATGHEPIVVFLHGGQYGRDETPPRFMREIEYLTRAGAVVVAPNVRNSIGYGVRYRELPYSLKGQIADLEAVIEDLRRRPELAEHKMFVFAVSSSKTLEAAFMLAHPDTFAGAINWVSTPEDLLTVGPLGGMPPMLWLSGRDERGALKFPDLASSLRERGLRLRHVIVEDDHTFRSGDASTFALDQVRRFVLERASLGCGR